MKGVIWLGLLTACGDPETGVKVFNAEPEPTILSISEGDQILEGAATALSGSITDPDNLAADLIATWLVDDQPVCVGSIAADGSTICVVVLAPDTTTEAADRLISLRGTDPSLAVGEHDVMVTVVPTETPTVALDEPLAFTTYYGDLPVDLIGDVRDGEDAASSLTVWWESSVDGFLGNVAPNPVGAIQASALLSTADHEITVYASDTSGKTGLASVGITVGPANSAPHCALSAEENPAPVGATLTLTGTATDVDVGSDQLTSEWMSDLDGPLGATEIGSDGETLLETDALSLGDHTITLTVTDEVGISCSKSLELGIRQAPTIALLSPDGGEIVDEGVALTLSSEVLDAEDVSLLLSVAYESNVDGTLGTASPGIDGVATLDVSTLTLGAHTLTATVTDTDDFTASASVDVVVNGVLSAPSLAISPESPMTTDDLVVAVVSEAVDQRVWASPTRTLGATKTAPSSLLPTPSTRGTPRETKPGR